MTTSTTPGGARTITVRVLLFASYADLAGTGALELSLPAGSTVADLVRAVRTSVRDGSRIPERPLVAVNQVHARADTPLEQAAEVALLPPLAGG
ncbi:MAG TPA: MoaD/ThiS family protein [Gemmatimonadales bacterium]|nr:MoaD/ThiS family protein [Gemmatimonadales bacterium]